VGEWDLVEAERRQLADLAAALTTEQWAAPSLCVGWKVHDVVAHVAGLPKMSVRSLLPAVIKNEFNVNKAIASLAIAAGTEQQVDVVSKLRSVATATRRPLGMKPAGILADALVHQQDIRRPLALPREIPEDRLRVALDSIKDNPALGSKKRIAGLRLVATDISWTHGTGSEVCGPAEALVMAMAGRRSACEDLVGEGLAVLAQR